MQMGCYEKNSLLARLSQYTKLEFTSVARGFKQMEKFSLQIKDTTLKAKSASHILLAEDEAHSSRVLSLILRKAGYSVTKVTDGEKALNMILDFENQGKLIDLLITDIQMPGLTGLELVSELRRRDMPINVLVITGYGDEITKSKLADEGLINYIVKPFNAEVFLKRVSQSIENNGGLSKDAED